MDNKPKYYVIEFEKPPSEDYDKYVCVPRSWVLGHNNGKIAFNYPTEKISVTNKRIQEGDEASNKWPMYLETVKYETDSISNAKQFRSLMERSFNKTRRRNSQANVKSNKTPTKPKVANKEIHDNIHSGNETDESDDERMEEEHCFEKSVDHNKPVEKNRFDGNAVRRGSTGGSKDIQTPNNLPTSSNTSNDSQVLHIISSTLQHLVKEIKRQNVNIEKLQQDFIVNRDATVHSTMLLKEITKKLMIDTNCSSSHDTVKENNTQAPAQSGMITKRRKSVRIQEDYERKEEGKGDEETPKKQYIRPFSLPREYDPKDSRWTLRYRDMTPGLEELMKGTGVYIDSIRFANCKRLARDEKTLARLLLVEIFTDQALGTCSLTGARAKAFDPDGTNTRPGLDERGRNVLLNFVEEYCHERRWVSSERQSIMNTLRNKMQEIRSRYIK